MHFYPNILGHADNFIPANPLVTPPHIVPEWYFTPFYAILRSCPNKLGGVIFMLAAILILFLIPFFKIPVNAVVGPLSFSHKVFFWSFCAVFFVLMFLGGKPATAPYVLASQIFTFLYFFYFLFLVPLVPLVERLLLDEYLVEHAEYEKEILAAYRQNPNNKNIWKEVKFKTWYDQDKPKEVTMMKKKHPTDWFYL